GCVFILSSRGRHTSCLSDWSSDVCSSDLIIAAALSCAVSVLGVLVPPSLVLILLGDAMMRAHTEASRANPAIARIVNTQDIFHEIGRASCRERVLSLLASGSLTGWHGRAS